MTGNPVEVRSAQIAKDFDDAKALIIEYVAWLNMDLSFQNFDSEMSSLPEMYSKQNGGLFIAYVDGMPVGVAGLRRFSETESEVKRMFVKPEARGLGAGKLLLTKCIETATDLQYKSIKLDTGDFMKAAIRLYADHGFVEIPAYRFNPHESARYFELKLATPDHTTPL